MTDFRLACPRFVSNTLLVTEEARPHPWKFFIVLSFSHFHVRRHIDKSSYNFVSMSIFERLLATGVNVHSLKLDISCSLEHLKLLVKAGAITNAKKRFLPKKIYPPQTFCRSQNPWYNGQIYDKNFLPSTFETAPLVGHYYPVWKSLYLAPWLRDIGPGSWVRYEIWIRKSRMT